MAKYDEQKILSELSKLSANESFMALERITTFVTKKLEAEKQMAEEIVEGLRNKIEKINSK